MAEDNEKEEGAEEKEEGATDTISEKLPPAAGMEITDQEAKTTKLPQKIQAAFLKKESPQEVFHTIKFMEDVPMRLHAEVARTELPLRNILSWKQGSIVKFDKIIGEPIEVLIGEQLIARGEVVVVNNRFGVRISEITRSDEKVGNLRS